MTKIRDFNPVVGIKPVRNLTLSTDGNFYTTTYQGGQFDGGTLVRYNYRNNQLIKVQDFNPNSFGRLSNESLSLRVLPEENCDTSDASAAIYNDGWQTGDNDGSGFGSWQFNHNGNAGNFIASSTENGDGEMAIMMGI